MKIEILFKEYAVYGGDSGNIQYLECFEKETGAEIYKTSINEEMRFLKEKIDIVYIGSPDSKHVYDILARLKKDREKILQKISEGQIFLVTGSAFDIFVSKIVLDRRYITKNFLNIPSNMCTTEKYSAIVVNEKGKKEIQINKIEKEYIIDGLDILPAISESKMLIRRNGLSLAKICSNGNSSGSNNSSNDGSREKGKEKDNILEDHPYITGYISSFTRSYPIYSYMEKGRYNDMEIDYLFSVERGSGINEEEKVEGFRVKNFFATYFLGPILPINPYFMEYILRLAGYEGDIPLFADLVRGYDIRLEEFKDPRRNIE